MKRHILLLPLAVSLSCVTYAQTRGVERQRFLSGPVQSLRVESGNLVTILGAGNAKTRVESRQRMLDFLYDDKGNLQESVRYDSSGGVSQREVFKYDDKNRLAEESRFESKDSLVEKGVHKYDQQGRRTETLLYDQKNNVIGKTVYVYDASGKLAEKLAYKGDQLTAKAALAYDAEGRLSSIIAYDSKGDIPNQVVTQYDDNANSAEKSRFGLKGNLEGRTVTAYDSKGSVVMIDHYRPNGSSGWKWEFEYDDKGNVIKEKLANKTSLSVWLYAYEYDSKGNWTKKTRSQLVNDHGKIVPSLSGVTFRDFKYYPGVVAAAITEPEDRAIVRDAVISLAAPEIRPSRSGAGLASLAPAESIGPPRISGTVQIELMIDPEGSVESARVVSGKEILSRDPAEVEQKLKKQTYRPVLVNGVPMRVVDTMSIKFSVPKMPRGRW